MSPPAAQYRVFPSDEAAIPELLKSRSVRFLSFGDWKLLDKLEVDNGKAKGKIREKFTTIPEMLKALESRGGPVSV